MKNNEIDQELSKSANDYRPSGFIADQTFPIITGPHKAPFHSIQVDVTFDDRANADPVFVLQFEEGRIHRGQDALFLDWEMRQVKLMSNPNTIKCFESAGDWGDYEKSDPLKEIKMAFQDVYKLTGFQANRILFSGTAWQHFRRNGKVLDNASNISGGGLYPSMRQMEYLLEMKVLVGTAWYDSGPSDGLNLSQIWGNHVWIYYCPDKPGMHVPSFGYCARPTDQHGFIVKRLLYDSRRHCYELEIGYSQEEFIAEKSMGVMIRNVTGES